MNRRVLLEPAAETVCIENSVPPLIFELSPEEGRRVLEEAQDAPVCLYPAQVEGVHGGHWPVGPHSRVPGNTGKQRVRGTCDLLYSWGPAGYSGVSIRMRSW